MSDPLARVLVVGTSGAGKSVLAGRVSERLGVPHVELDDLYWRPGWRPREREDFLERVRDAAAGERWVITGNYSTTAAPITWPRATAVAWLDYPFGLTMARVLRRTFRRTVMRERCCNGNLESPWRALLTKDSILWWVITTHGRNAVAYPPRLEAFRASGRLAIRLRHPREADAWVAGLSAQVSTRPREAPGVTSAGDALSV